MATAVVRPESVGWSVRCRMARMRDVSVGPLYAQNHSIRARATSDFGCDFLQAARGSLFNLGS